MSVPGVAFIHVAVENGGKMWKTTLREGHTAVCDIRVLNVPDVIFVWEV